MSLLHFETTIVEVIDNFDEKTPSRWSTVNVMIKFENGVIQKHTMNLEEYKINQKLEEFKKKLSKKDYNKLIEIMEDHGSNRYGEGIADECESQAGPSV